jgi:hypothetical protein
MVLTNHLNLQKESMTAFDHQTTAAQKTRTVNSSYLEIKPGTWQFPGSFTICSNFTSTNFKTGGEEEEEQEAEPGI